jgi:hypothetical protein
VATGRITRGTPLRVVDAILTGIHQPGESHFELLRAFADDAVLNQISAKIRAHSYRNHEFGDSLLVECRPSPLSERLSGVSVNVAAYRNVASGPKANREELLDMEMVKAS